MAEDNSEELVDAEKGTLDPCSNEQNVDSQTDTFQLFPNSALDDELASQVLKEKEVVFIVLGGPKGSGKTTLPAMLFERFQSGQIDDYRFAGSLTMFEFERICHDGRGSSERLEPITQRTSRQLGRQFYHLKIQVISSMESRDLIFVDMSGEEFKDIRSFDGYIDQLRVLARADYFLVLFDGNRLSEPLERHVAADEIRTALHVLQENDIIHHNLKIQIAFSKNDEIEKFDDEYRTGEFIDAVTDKLSQEFSSIASFHRITSRNPKDPSQKALGVNELISSWMRHQKHETTTFDYDPLPQRPFDRFRVVK